MATRKWRDVRADANLDPDKVAEAEQQLLGEIRAARLAEMRKSRKLTQRQVAARMKVSQARVSAIEKGEFGNAEVGTVAKYVDAIGGRLEIVADFGDERLRVG
jgi:predicted XRE-type DNA-binding protein